MLERLASLSVRDLAEKAKAARDARDRILTGIRNEALGELPVARGEHNPAAALGLNVLPEGDPDRKALENALSGLPAPVLRELWALVLVGRGDYGLKDWEQAMAEVDRMTEIDVRLFMDQAELHDYLMKAVYEIERL